MRKVIFHLLAWGLCSHAFAQLAPLTVEEIMREPKWIGTSPSDIHRTPEVSKSLFNWNFENLQVCQTQLK